MFFLNKLSDVSSNFGDIFLINKAGIAPTPVIRPAAKLAKNPYSIMVSLVIINFLFYNLY